MSMRAAVCYCAPSTASRRGRAWGRSCTLFTCVSFSTLWFQRDPRTLASSLPQGRGEFKLITKVRGPWRPWPPEAMCTRRLMCVSAGVVTADFDYSSVLSNCTKTTCVCLCVCVCVCVGSAGGLCQVWFHSPCSHGSVRSLQTQSRPPTGRQWCAPPIQTLWCTVLMQHHLCVCVWGGRGVWGWGCHPATLLFSFRFDPAIDRPFVCSCLCLSE